jgi:hypothetical protein
MSQPEIVQTDLADEEVVARVDLGGEDELFVTPTRTLVYRAEGLLSDESVEKYDHDAERVTVSEGRRKAKVTLDYGLDGQETISLPAKRLERAIQPIFEGVLKANGVLAADERIERLFRFSELTIAIASERVVRHIGANLWDEDFEAYHYGDVTDLEFEDGSVATSVVLTVDGRRERFKAPNEDARAVRAALETTLLSYWDVETVEELRAAAAPDEDEPGATEATGATDREEVSFGDGPDPLIADPDEPEKLPENATRNDDPDAEDRPTQEPTPAPEPTEQPSQATADAVAQQVERPAESGSTESDVPASRTETDTTRDTLESEDDPLAASGSGPDPIPDTDATSGRQVQSGGTESASDSQGARADAAAESEPTTTPAESEPATPAESEPATPTGDERTADAAVGDARDVSSEGATTPADESRADSGDEFRRGAADASAASDPSPSSTPTVKPAETDEEPGVASPSAADVGFEGSGFESAAPTAEEQIREELADLREVVDQQNAELRAQRELIEQLIEELRRGR